MEENKENTALPSATQATRRTAIKTSTGMLGLSAIGLGSASATQDSSQSRTTFGETVFAEVGFTLKEPQLTY